MTRHDTPEEAAEGRATSTGTSAPSVLRTVDPPDPTAPINPSLADASPSKQPRRPRGILLARGDLVTPTPITWLWEPYLPFGKPAILQGYPGEGKSQVMIDIAARLTRGDVMPDGTDPHVTGSVLWITDEDDIASVLTPRFEAAGAVMERVMMMDRQSAEFSLPSGVGTLARIIAATNERVDVPVRLVVLDPFGQYVDKGLNPNSNEARRVVSACGELAEAFSVSFTIINHLNKSGTKDDARNAMERGAGNLSGIAGRARAVLHCGPDPNADDEEDSTHLLLPVKNNYGPLGTALRYVIEPVFLPLWHAINTSCVRWLGPSGYSADDVTRPLSQDEQGQLDRAEAWLDTHLEAPEPYKVLEEAARGAGISQRTLRRARKSLQDRGRIEKRFTPGEGNRGAVWQRCERGQVGEVG